MEGSGCAYWQTRIELLKTMPRIKPDAAVDILAEIGLDLSVYGSAEHAAIWASVCLSYHESAANANGAGHKVVIELADWVRLLGEEPN